MEKIFRHRKYIIAFYLLLILLAFLFIPKLRIEYNLERFLPAGHPELKFLQKYEKKLEPDDNYIFVGVENQGSIFHEQFLVKLNRFTLSARDLPYIKHTVSLTTLKEPVKTALGFTRVKLIHPGEPSRYTSDSTRVFTDPRWPGYMISHDGRSAMVLLKTEDYLIQKEAEQLVKKLKDHVEQYSFHATHLAGRAISQVTILKKIKDEIIFYIFFTCFILIVILYFIFRKPLGILIPLSSVIIGLVLFLGILGLFGVPLDLMSTLYPALMLIIGMSDVIHIMTRYIDENQNGRTRTEAMKITIREIGMATLFTSLTTSTGFLVLLSSNIQPLQSFGIWAAVGVFVAYITVIGFTTLVLVGFDSSRLTNKEFTNYRWKKLTFSFYFYIRKKERQILLYFLLFTGLCLWGISQTSTNMHLLSDIPRDHKLRQDFTFFEENFSGARPVEIAAIPQNGRTIKDPEVIHEILKLEKFLKNEIHQINHLVSPLTVFRSIHKALEGNRIAAYKIPDDTASLTQTLRYLDKAPKNNFTTIMSRDLKIGRISAFIKDIGSDRVWKIYEKIRAFEKRQINPQLVDFRITGKLYLVDINNQQLTKSLFSGLFLAFLAVGLLMGLLFKNIKIIFISLLPNIIPLVVTGALMGWAGIEFKATTSIIFTIAFGIAVDDTIHFLTRFRIELAKGASTLPAIRRTFLESGRAIILTTIILLAGFLSLSTSDFTITSQIGLLISVTLFSALFSDLFILPILLRRFL